MCATACRGNSKCCMTACLAGSIEFDDLQPSDVLVAVSDLAAAGPLIDAVFGTAPPRRYAPHSVSDHWLAAFAG